MEELGLLYIYLSILLGGAMLIGLLLLALIYKGLMSVFSKYLLGGIIFLLILHLNTYLFFITGQFHNYPGLLGISYPGLFLIGPFYFLFIRNTQHTDFQWQKLDVLHFLPFLLVLFLQIPYYFKSNSDQKLIVEYLYNDLPGYGFNFQNWLIDNAFMWQIIAYVLASLWLLKGKSDALTKKIRKFSIIIFATGIFYLIFQTGLIVAGINALTSEIFFASIFSLVIFALGYNMTIFNSVFDKTLKYKTSPISFTKAESIMAKIIRTLEEQKLFTNQNLKIKDLSEAIGIPSHHISQVLNERMEGGFRDLINKYRIDYARKLFVAGTTERLSIEAIGEESGFKTKSSFYRAFKKYTGMTPTAFMEAKQTI